jgi:hypothetical protein
MIISPRYLFTAVHLYQLLPRPPGRGSIILTFLQKGNNYYSTMINHGSNGSNSFVVLQ